jgi:hypothetical protein
MARSLSNRQASVEQTTYLSQMQAYAADYRGKKDLLSKIVQAMNQMAPQRSNNTNGNGPQGGNLRNM